MASTDVRAFETSGQQFINSVALELNAGSPCCPYLPLEVILYVSNWPEVQEGFQWWDAFNHA